jgi:hypothetical protein
MGFFLNQPLRGTPHMFKLGIGIKSLLLLSLPVLVRAEFNYWNPEDTATIPKTLSATGLYANGSITAAKKVLLPNAYKFEVNAALWSDGAHKTRWFMVKPGKAIGFDEKNDYYKYPDSTVFIKQFAIDTIPGDTTSRVLWETRFLVSKKEIADTSKKNFRIDDRWYATTYRWNADQKDAVLVKKSGLDDSIRVYPDGNKKPFKQKKWHFPGRSQCDQCHRVDYADKVHGRSILGFFTAQLNRPHPDSANINQLEYFFQKGVMTGNRPGFWDQAPRWANIKDNSASVDLRARAYIAANCSGCHGTRGMETGATFGVSLNYDFHTMESQMEFRQRSVSWPFGLDTLPPFKYKVTDLANPDRDTGLVINPALIVPGYPNKSVLLFRQQSRNTKPSDYDPDRNQMPPLGSFEVDTTAIALLTRWVNEMNSIWAPNSKAYLLGVHKISARILLKSPIIEGRTLRLPPELAGDGNVMVSLTSLAGRTQALNQTGRGVYAIPASLNPGVYIIRVGNKTYTRQMF